jgi:hypothetical protein
MKANAVPSRPASSVHSGVDSAVSLSDHERKPMEAMPAIRARLGKSGTGRSSSTVRPAPGAYSTPHQNPVQMVQEMVGRVKVWIQMIIC